MIRDVAGCCFFFYVYVARISDDASGCGWGGVCAVVGQMAGVN